VTTILVRGVGEFGSAIAHRCFIAGHIVALHDVAQPDTCHRWMPFADALFDERAGLDGVAALRVGLAATLPRLAHEREVVPIVTEEITSVLAVLQPDILIDARMRKRMQPESQRGLAPLTIGVGPNFVAGQSTDLAVETGFGPDFGRALSHSATRPVDGEPPAVLGHSRERFLYAPGDGVFRTARSIGKVVESGDIVGHVEERPLRAAVGGALRRLTHDGVPATTGTRVIEVDPRGPEAVIRGVGPRQARVADAVMPSLNRV